MANAPITADGEVFAAARTPAAARLVPFSLLFALLLDWLVFDQILLWRFLGLIPSWAVVLLTLATIGATAAFLRRWPLSGFPGASPRVLLAAAAVALVVFLLGGEGRLFYATTDWQVRSAVLHDLVYYPWPFVYAVRAAPDLLRAPLGMYLAPALVGKAAGFRAAEFAVLAQNTAVLTLVIGLGSALFDTARARWIALAIFLGFSGLDAIGQFMAGQPLYMNAERWNLAVYTAHVTQAFWVPQHGMAGWIGAVLYLLWRDGKAPLAAVLIPLPLLALWSPLAAMGIIPFAAHAGLQTLKDRGLRITDIAWPAAVSLLALPGLLYLAAGSGAVGAKAAVLPFHQYVAFEALEVGPYLLALWCIGRSSRFGGMTLLILTATLLLIPFGQVGRSNDFVMRASIPALAILAVCVADMLVRPPVEGDRLWRGVLAFALGVGLVTPAFEIWRAVTLPRGPRVVCSYFGVVPGGFDTYIAPLSRVSPLVAPAHPAAIKPNDPPHCWNSPWPEPMLYPDGINR